MEAAELEFRKEFQEKVFQHNNLIFHIANTMLDYGVADAEDITQNVLLKLYRQFQTNPALWHRLKSEPKALYRYITHSASNAVLDHLRGNPTLKRPPDAHAADDYGREKPAWAESSPATQERALFEREIKEHVTYDCRVIAGIYKEVLLRIMADPDISYKDLAVGLQVSEKKIRYSLVPQLKESIPRCSVFRKCLRSSKGDERLARPSK